MMKKIALLISNLFEKPFPKDKLIAERYQVITHLGAGGYGHSYLVYDLESRQKKVLKALRLHKRLTSSGRGSFELEKELLDSIDHPGFPRYFEEGIYNNIPFFTMEFIEGMNFEQLIFLEGRKISEKEAFQIINKLLTPLEYLHNRKIVHRDIRIPNVITDGSNIRLIDLGLGRHFHHENEAVKTKEKHLRKEINFQADFYGLGHFLLFLLYSNFTFSNDIHEKSWEEELKISNHAKHIIRRLLQIEPAYENCAQIRAEIINLYLI
ncbi:protein kinase domain-containing protein [Bacillus sp. X1(2014)]|uniref:serine/threonine protein kinase n=1 Tax=Bacillus sp. X1(2014) TaxID=1565991 RepID=UPI0011A10C52|nr:protein kinase [Bacillus sp. X1(2014)]